jgi:hypothetical protein
VLRFARTRDANLRMYANNANCESSLSRRIGLYLHPKFGCLRVVSTESPTLCRGSLGIAVIFFKILGFTDIASYRDRLLDQGASFLTRKGIALILLRSNNRGITLIYTNYRSGSTLMLRRHRHFCCALYVAIEFGLYLTTRYRISDIGLQIFLSDIRILISDIRTFRHIVSEGSCTSL